MRWGGLFRHFEVFIVDVTDGNCIATEIHDEMAITEDADDVTFLTLEGTGEDSELDVVLGEFQKWVTEEGYAFWLGLHHSHEWLHDAVLDGCRHFRGAIIDEMVTGEIIFKEGGELFGLTLQEDETADGGFFCLHHSFTVRLAFVVCRAVNKTIWYVLPFCSERFQFFLKVLHKIMANEEVAPRCFLSAFGHNFYSWSRIFINLNYVYALWQTLALARFYVGCRRRMRAILRHFLYLFYVTAGISHL